MERITSKNLKGLPAAVLADLLNATLEAAAKGTFPSKWELAEIFFKHGITRVEELRFLDEDRHNQNLKHVLHILRKAIADTERRPGMFPLQPGGLVY